MSKKKKEEKVFQAPELRQPVELPFSRTYYCVGDLKDGEWGVLCVINNIQYIKASRLGVLRKDTLLFRKEAIRAGDRLSGTVAKITMNKGLLDVEIFHPYSEKDMKSWILQPITGAALEAGGGNFFYFGSYKEHFLSDLDKDQWAWTYKTVIDGLPAPKVQESVKEEAA